MMELRKDNIPRWLHWTLCPCWHSGSGETPGSSRDTCRRGGETGRRRPPAGEADTHHGLLLHESNSLRRKLYWISLLNYPMLGLLFFSLLKILLIISSNIGVTVIGIIYNKINQVTVMVMNNWTSTIIMCEQNDRYMVGANVLWPIQIPFYNIVSIGNHFW